MNILGSSCGREGGILREYRGGYDLIPKGALVKKQIAVREVKEWMGSV